MKKIRDQVRKENKAMKSNVKEKAKAIKKITANAVDNVMNTTNGLSGKAAQAKSSVIHSAQIVKAYAKGILKKPGKIYREFSLGVSKGVTEGKHTDHDAVRKVKHDRR